jgi:predicted transcriptional regulator
VRSITTCPTDPVPDAGTTLHIRVGQGDQLRERARERLQAAEHGEELDDMEPVLDFESLTDFERVMTEYNIELLRAIAREDPANIRETAQLVDRGYKEVHTALTELASLNVIEFEREGSAKRPVVRFDDIEIEVEIAGG